MLEKCKFLSVKVLVLTKELTLHRAILGLENEFIPVNNWL
jgi:hypothetical protein